MKLNDAMRVKDLIELLSQTEQNRLVSWINDDGIVGYLNKKDQGDAFSEDGIVFLQLGTGIEDVDDEDLDIHDVN